MSIQLIVGLGNPGAEYDKTRHNAGAWFVEALAQQFAVSLKNENKFAALYAQVPPPYPPFRLILPTTYMNHSGQAVSAVARFYKIPAENILVAHDELDYPAGKIRLKTGGGHGGHNGLRDIIRHLGSNHFHRLRIGIGHPGSRDDVLNYVLGRPSISDRNDILSSIDQALACLDNIAKGDIASAMQDLHSNN